MAGVVASRAQLEYSRSASDGNQDLRSWLYVEGLWPTSAVGCHLVRLQLHLVAFQDVPFSSVC